MSFTIAKGRNIFVELRMGRSNNDSFVLEISDKTSHQRILDIKIPLANVADFFSNRNTGWAEDEFIPAEYYPNEMIGKTRQLKEVSLKIKDNSFEQREKDLVKQVNKWNKYADVILEGWKIESTEWRDNSYNLKEETYQAMATRYV